MQDLTSGWHPAARRIVSPNFDARPAGEAPTLIVVHAISLPPDQFGGPGVEQLFTNTLDPAAHPYYATIHPLRVSAHFFIRRDGELIQFVSTDARAWHAGVSCWRGRAREALGDLPGALADYQAAYDLNPDSTPALDELQRLGG